ncbi:MAG TPA: hypothetical protein ENK18_17975 [Deltaproteobacteria bacterium]|nr:hypothetical protein [Deltaproteobacteria bacterium]
MFNRTIWAVAVLCSSCSGTTDDPLDTGIPGAARCGSTAAPGVFLGQGVGGAFAALTDGATVGLDIAPQGGFGVSVQVETVGLIGEAPATVTVRTEIDGAPSGSFTFEDDEGQPTLQLFCKDDGRATLGSGVAVGFDPERWSQDNLTDLDNTTADLIVEVTDVDGTMAEGRSTVLIVVGG